MERERRYQRNQNAFSPAELDRILTQRIAIVGCGGLGGYAANGLARFGVGHLSLIDGDVFSESNLNRQLFCLESNIGKSKVKETQRLLAEINSSVSVSAHSVYLQEDNGAELLEGHDLVLDCLDSIPARYLLEKQTEELGIPVIHGAIAGFLGQVSLSLPGDQVIRKVYGTGKEEKGVEVVTGNPSFIPQVVAGFQVSMGLQLLAGREKLPRKKLFYMDLMNYAWHEIPLN